MKKVFSPSAVSQFKRDAKRQQKLEPTTPLCSILDRIASANGFDNWFALQASSKLSDLHKMGQAEVEEKYGITKAEDARDYELVMRSKTTFGTDSERITVFQGQDANEVAERIAEGYGATVESLRPV